MSREVRRTVAANATIAFVFNTVSVVGMSRRWTARRAPEGAGGGRNARAGGRGEPATALPAQGVSTRRIGSPTLFSRRATASAASASGTWAVMEGARSIRPAEARPTSCSTCSGSEP